MTASATSSSFFGQLSQRISSAWGWWTGELSAAMPSKLRTWFSANIAVVDIAVDAGAGAPALVLIKPESAELKELKRVIVDSREPGRLRTQVDELLRGQGRDARLVLAPSTVLRKRWSLPLATEENLQAVIGFDMDRQTPFSADQVYYGARVINRDVVREKIDVEVAVVPRNTIDPWLADLRAAGVSVQSMVAADDLGKVYAPIELMPAHAKPERRWSRIQRLNLVLLLCALALALAAVVLPIWQKRQSVIDIMPLAAKANAEYAVTQRISGEYTKLANEYNFILGKKHGTFPVTQIVEDLTKAFPDNTWLKTFELKTQPKLKSVEITGDAPSVSKIIETLDQTSMFQNTQQKTQTQRGVGNLEQFNVTAELKARPLPEALALDAAGNATAVTTSAAANATTNTAAAPAANPTATAGTSAAGVTPTATVTAPPTLPPGAPSKVANTPAAGAPKVTTAPAPLLPGQVPQQKAVAVPGMPMPPGGAGGTPPPMVLSTPQGMGFASPNPGMPSANVPQPPSINPGSTNLSAPGLVAPPPPSGMPIPVPSQVPPPQPYPLPALARPPS
jgi:general secretion pathway protein L